MILLLSPSKIMKMDQVLPQMEYSTPVFMNRADELARQLQKLSEAELGKLLGITTKLVKQNYERFAVWSKKKRPPQAIPSVFAYHGEVYHGFQAHSLQPDDLLFSQNHVRILSGLYGVLRPLDLIQAYRLDVSSPLIPPGSGNLYSYWTSMVTKQIKKEMAGSGSKLLINLASQEYFKMLDIKSLQGSDLITPVFLENSPGGYKTVTVYAKRARGLMARFVVQNRITESEYLKAFDLEGYCFNPSMSDTRHWVFSRR